MSLPPLRAMRPSYATLTQSVPPGFEIRVPKSRSNYMDDKWDRQSREGQHCPTQINYRSTHATPISLASLAAFSPGKMLGECVLLKGSFRRWPVIPPTNQVMRDSS